ncbi:hypothetical protein P5W98_00665 [Paraburkholderia sp. A1BS-2L]|uniref:hypothetical protein n=1 Tax=Paraburkholderia sp. A1BS-2L TaxID=3028373 RepID=UPI003DA96FB5
MFIDKPTVPVQLEVVLDLLYAIRQKSATAESVRALLQPQGLPGLTNKSNQAHLHLNAAKELGLVAEEDEGNLRLNYAVRNDRPTPREAILDAFDRVALGSPDVEPWFGRLYSYVIMQLNDCVPTGEPVRVQLASDFNAGLADHIEKRNPLNSTKLTHYLRWYVYVGLGWFDPMGRFIPDPTERLRRALPNIFSDQRRLDAAPFMSALAVACPELDGGSLFMDMSSGRYDFAARSCSRALAVGLRNLHEDGVIRLECPKDSMGWGLERGGSVRVPGLLDSDRFDRVSLLQRN